LSFPLGRGSDLAGAAGRLGSVGATDGNDQSDDSVSHSLSHGEKQDRWVKSRIVGQKARSWGKASKIARKSKQDCGEKQAKWLGKASKIAGKSKQDRGEKKRGPGKGGTAALRFAAPAQLAFLPNESVSTPHAAGVVGFAHILPQKVQTGRFKQELRKPMEAGLRWQV
jgi:hypothetical protein